MHLYRDTPDGEKWWRCPETRAEAMDEVRYYIWMQCPLTAMKMIVALCASVDQTGDSKYDESLEDSYETYYQQQHRLKE